MGEGKIGPFRREAGRVGTDTVAGDHRGNLGNGHRVTGPGTRDLNPSGPKLRPRPWKVET